MNTPLLLICLHIFRHNSKILTKYMKDKLQFLFRLTKNLTLHLSDNNRVGLP